MNVIFLGPPGVGKGTYSSRISVKLSIPHISTGDLFRAAIKEESELGLKVKKYVEGGDLVPDDVTVQVLEERLEKDDAKKGFILDGFPRTIEQADALENIAEINVVINLSVEDDVLIQKISARRICKNCGEIYNIADIHFGENNQYHMPPMLPKEEGKCDKCGGPLIQRDDDKIDVVKERLELYNKETQPLIDYYREKGLIKDVQVIGSPEVMVPKIMEIMKK
jgi:adenylate kinase